MCRLLNSNGLIKQWGVVTDTTSGSNWKTNNLYINYTNSSYSIYLQGYFQGDVTSTFIVNKNTSTKTNNSFQFHFGQESNYCDYLTIGY